MTTEENNTLYITIYGDITSWEWLESDVSSYTLSKLISESKAQTIQVNINSYGGEVAEGLAIYNALKNHPAKVITRCDGFACSAASVIFMAGEERLMNEASLLMIHNAWTSASGNAKELRKQANDLEVISKATASAYLTHIKMSEEELQEMLDAESWIEPNKAIEKGFATGIITEKISSKQQYSVKRKIIEQLVNGRDNGYPIKDEPISGFHKLFDTFNKKTTQEE